MRPALLVLALLVAAFLAAACGAPVPPTPTGPREIDERPPSSPIVANLYLPASAEPARPGVVVLGGSEGGIRGAASIARALADRGYPAEAVSYFGSPGQPTRLADIPLEQFLTAIGELARQPGVDPRRMVLWGTSRGSEAALLVAADHPDLVDAVVAHVPSSVVNPGFPDPIRPAWTRAGQPVPSVPRADVGQPTPVDAPDAIIPVERIRGPVLTICGGLDAVWPSCPYSAAIARRADTRPGVPPTTALAYPDAGHTLGVLGPPALGVVAGDTTPQRTGGTIGSNARTAADAGPRVLAFLDGL